MDEANTQIQKDFVLEVRKEQSSFDPNSTGEDCKLHIVEKVENKNENKPRSSISSKEKEVSREISKLDILKKLSSGTPLREALDNIVSGGMGALIVVSNKDTNSIFQGGFKINCKFSSKRLTELAKMDGAIILSEDFKKIICANTLLTPNKNLTTSETGTRHQAAERTAKQTGAMVIAVSERIGKITIYYGNSKYVLQDTEELLRRTTETIQILEKQREVFDELINNLNLLEINNLVSVGDICSVLERLEVIKKMSNIINEYIVELGKDGIILRMRMREITKGIEKTEEQIVKDYSLKSLKVKQFFNNLSFDGLLNLENIASVLFSKPLDSSVVPKGFRVLSKTHLSKEEIEGLIKHFKNIDGVFSAGRDSVRRIIKDNPDRLQKELSNLREQILVGKKL